MPIFENDRPLLDAFRRGARDALTHVYYRFVDDVSLLVRRGFTLDGDPPRYVPGAKDPDQERELVQEVFLRAFAERARLAFDGLRPYRPYLLRIAKNLLVDRVRARQPVPLADLDALELEAPNAHTAEAERSFEEALDWQRLTAATASFVAGLDAEAQAFVRLRFTEEQSQDEVARQMGITRRRVRTLEHDVQAGLARFLKKQGRH